MDDRSYSLIFKGKTLSGFTRNEVIQLVSAYLGKSPQSIQKLFQGRAYVVLKNLDSKSAARELRVFQSFGVSCELRRTKPKTKIQQPVNVDLKPASTAGHCPKCRAGLREMDKNADECPYCGIIISKYRSAMQARSQAKSQPPGRRGASHKDSSDSAETATNFAFEPVLKGRMPLPGTRLLATMSGLAIIVILAFAFAGSREPAPSLSGQETGLPEKEYIIRQPLKPDIENPRIVDKNGLADGGIPCVDHKYLLDHGKSYDLVFHTRLPPLRESPEETPEISFQHFTNLEGSFENLSESYITINPDGVDLDTYQISVWAMDRSGYLMDSSQLTIEDGLSVGNSNIFKVYWITDAIGLITLGGPFSRIEEVGRMPESEIRSALADASDFKHPDAPYQLHELPIFKTTYTGYVAAVKFNVYVPTYNQKAEHFEHINYSLDGYGKLSLTLKSWRDKIIIKGPDERPNCF